VIAPAELRGHAPVGTGQAQLARYPALLGHGYRPSWQHLAGSERLFGTLARENILRRQGREGGVHAVLKTTAHPACSPSSLTDWSAGPGFGRRDWTADRP
jgi:hypothetical protein